MVFCSFYRYYRYYSYIRNIYLYSLWMPETFLECYIG